MFIQTAPTPNHNAIKFLPGSHVSSSPKHFANAEEAYKVSPLAVSLFLIEGVSAVFLGEDFITITKNENYEWEQLKPQVLYTIMDHITNNLPIVYNVNNTIEQRDLSEIEQKIIEIIDHRVRPAVAMDGGDIEFDSFTDGVVKLILKGACGGCPSASVTLKDGIESMLKYYIPEVKSVESV